MATSNDSQPVISASLALESAVAKKPSPVNHTHTLPPPLTACLKVHAVPSGRGTPHGSAFPSARGLLDLRRRPRRGAEGCGGQGRGGRRESGAGPGEGDQGRGQEGGGAGQ